MHGLCNRTCAYVCTYVLTLTYLDVWVFCNTAPPRAVPGCRRYHYNVNTSRLLVHVQKGWEDGLYISSVSSCANLWAIVMDAGTDFTQQIYKVSYRPRRPRSPPPLPHTAASIAASASDARCTATRLAR